MGRGEAAHLLDSAAGPQLAAAMHGGRGRHPKVGGNVNSKPYLVVEVAPRACIDCQRGASYRVVDTRKKYGERYTAPLRCKPCAITLAAQRNASCALSPSPKVEKT